MAVLVLVPVVVIALVVTLTIARRQRPDAPTQPGHYAVPAQLDRSDFASPDVPWLVVVFTSATCDSCRGTWEKAQALAGPEVAVQEVEFTADRELHERYDVEAVPMLLLADADGVVRASFIGTPSASELWAAVSDVRDGTI